MLTHNHNLIHRQRLALNNAVSRKLSGHNLQSISRDIPASALRDVMSDTPPRLLSDCGWRRHVEAPVAALSDLGCQLGHLIGLGRFAKRVELGFHGLGLEVQVSTPTASVG